jgi:hypothetical protein
MSDEGPEEPRDGETEEPRDEEPEEPRDGDGGDGLPDLALRDEPARGPSWLSTYGSPLFRIGILLVLLVGLVLLRKPCADGMAGFVGNFGQPVGQVAPRDGGGGGPAPGDAAPRH